VDLSKLSTADKLILGGGIAYLIFMFFPWYGLSGGSNSGWDYFLGGVIPLLLVAVMCVQVALTNFAPETKLPDPPVPWAQVHLIAGIAAAVIVFLRLLIGSSIDTPIGDIDLDRKFGLFLAFIAVVVVALGGFQKQQDPDVPSAGGSEPGGSAPF